MDLYSYFRDVPFNVILLFCFSYTYIIAEVILYHLELYLSDFKLLYFRDKKYFIWCILSYSYHISFNSVYSLSVTE